MLIITAVFAEMLSNLPFQMSQLMKKGGQTSMLRVPVYSGVQTLLRVELWL